MTIHKSLIYLLALGSFSLSQTVSAQELKVKLISSAPLNNEINLAVNRCINGITIDWGDGKAIDYTFDNNNFICPISGKIKGDTITISGSSDWYMLDCSDCSLTKLDLSQNRQLHSLYCQGNQLKSLDLRGMNKLVDLNCSSNQISSFVFTDINNPEEDLSNIEVLNISNNKLKGHYNIKLGTLQYINACNNAFEKFFIHDPDLRTMNISNNNISNGLSLLSSTRFNTLKCDGNKIMGISINNQGEAAQQILCSNNKIKKLDLSKATALTDLDCSYNELNDIAYDTKAPLSIVDLSNNLLTFEALPSIRDKAEYFYFNPQAPFDITLGKGISIKDNTPYAPIVSSWNDRFKQTIDISDFCKLASNRFDATYEVYEVKDDGSSQALDLGTSITSPGDYYVTRGKFSFFTPHKKAYIELKSKTYGFILRSSMFAIGDDITAIHQITKDADNLSITAQPGELIIHSTLARQISILTVAGKRIWSGTINGTQCVNLPQGVYIVDGKKVVL